MSCLPNPKLDLNGADSSETNNWIMQNFKQPLGTIEILTFWIEATSGSGKKQEVLHISVESSQSTEMFCEKGQAKLDLAPWLLHTPAAPLYQPSLAKN